MLSFLLTLCYISQRAMWIKMDITYKITKWEKISIVKLMILSTILILIISSLFSDLNVINGRTTAAGLIEVKVLWKQPVHLGFLISFIITIATICWGSACYLLDILMSALCTLYSICCILRQELLSQFYRWEDLAAERLSNMPKDTHN